MISEQPLIAPRTSKEGMSNPKERRIAVLCAKGDGLTQALKICQPHRVGEVLIFVALQREHEKAASERS